ncbi:uncharacterized protein ACRADG_010046 [Cochliomyia hominivorax]
MNKIIVLLMTIIFVTSSSSDPTTQESINQKILSERQTAHISPEIIDEFKDFANLISTTTIDEIVAKHYVVDGNFRTAFKYLRSQEFTQLQQQLLNIPEIIDILEFLHLTTTANATMRHMGATKMTMAGVKASIDDDYNDVADADNRDVQMTTNTGTIIISNKPHTLTIENVKEDAVSYKKDHKRPQQFQIDADDAENAISRISNKQQPLVDIVLLEDSEVNANVYNKDQRKQHQLHHHYFHPHKYQLHYNNNHHHHHDEALGTFTTFVEEVLEHLPHSTYQNMIKEKCQKNAKFAEFYKALRSPEFKPLVDKYLLSANIIKVVQTLNSHNVDVKSLEPIAFQVISWGPNP